MPENAICSCFPKKWPAMSIDQPDYREKTPLYEALEDALFFAEGQARGPHNMLRIEAEALTPEEEELLKSRDYTVIFFGDSDIGAENLERLDHFFHAAQSYATGGSIPADLPQGKVALVISQNFRTAFRESNTYRGGTWRRDSQYCEVIFPLPKESLT